MDNAPPDPAVKAVPPAPSSPAASAPSAAAPAGQRRGFDQAQTELCLEALKQFRIGLSQALLYNADSKQFGKAADNTFAAMNAVLAAIGAFKLGLAKSDVLINGQRIEVPSTLRSGIESLEKVMTAAGCGGLKFDKGLEAPELGTFLQLLARKKLPRGEGAKVNQLIREQGITHIQLDELRYVAVSKGQMVVSGNARAQAVHMAAQKALSELVDSVLGIINNVEDEEAKRRLRADLADQLVEKSDPMLSSMLAASSQRLKSAPSAEQAALAAIPSRDGSLLNHVLHAGNLMLKRSRSAGGAGPGGSGHGSGGAGPGAGGPGSAGAGPGGSGAGSGAGGAGAGQPQAALADDELSTMREVVEQLVNPYKSRPEDILGQMQVEGESVSLLPEWLLRAYTSIRSQSPQDRLQGILQQSPAALLNEQMYPQISGVMDDLAKARMGAEAGQLSAHVVGSLRAPTRRERAKAVQRLTELVERPQADEVPEAVNTIEDELMDTCAHETTDDVMKLLLDHLTHRCIHHYKTGNFARVNEHLDWIVGLDESARLAMREEQDNLGRQAIEQLAKSDLAPLLADDMLADGDKGKTARRILQLLGPGACAAIVQRIALQTDEAKAQTLAKALREMGKEAVDLFFAALGQETDGAAILRMMNVSHLVSDGDELWALLPALLRHADSAVSAKATSLVMQRDGQAALDMLLAAAKENPDAERRKLFVQVAALLRDPAVQTGLLSKLDAAVNAGQFDDQNNVFSLEVLSAAGNRGFVPILTKAMSPRGRTLVLSASSGVRLPRDFVLAAIKALGSFYQEPPVAEILERLRKDKDTEIARAALVCFRGMLVSEHPKPDAAAPVQGTHGTAVAAKTTEAAVPPRRDQKTGLVSGSSPPRASAAPAGQTQAASGDGQREKTGTRTVPPPLPPPPSQGPREQPTIKSVMQGRIQDIGLVATLRMVAAKDGLLKLTSPRGQGGIYLVGGKVLNATFTGGDGIQKDGAPALAILSGLGEADFTYLHGVPPPRVTLNLEIDKMQEGLRQYRDSHTRRFDF